MSIITRVKNLWFLSSISKEDMIANPHSFIQRAINAQESHGVAYISGYSEEEQIFVDSLNANGEDTKV